MSPLDLIHELVDNLTLDDIELLNNLTGHEALSRFSAKPRQEILTELKLSEASIRKSIIRLEAMSFIKVHVKDRKQVLHLTLHGQMAIHTIFERGNV